MWYTLWNDIFDAHRDNRKRFVVRAEEKLTAFVELRPSMLSRSMLALFLPSKISTFGLLWS